MSDEPILVYMACPYSHPLPEARESRFIAACKAADALMREGLVVFSPLSHSHPIEVNRDDGKIDGGDFWLLQDFPWLDRCDALIVLQLDGWLESRGVAAEIERWTEKGGPLAYWYRDDTTAAMVAEKVRYDVEFSRKVRAPEPEPILAEAARITSTERQRDYGHPRENFAAIAGMWNSYWGAKPSKTFTATDVAMFFSLTKIARHANAAKRDNLVDLAGYARCGAQCDGFEA